jgi:hypothetical protein
MVSQMYVELVDILFANSSRFIINANGNYYDINTKTKYTHALYLRKKQLTSFCSQYKEVHNVN